ncbi:MAG: hypothetical protein AAFP76_05875 [Bacteroidota bacterium]
MSTEDQQLIENYLRGSLSEAEKRDFHERLEMDPGFRDVFNFEKQLFDTLSEKSWSFVEKTDSQEVKEYTALFKKKETQELKESLEEAASNYKNQKPGKGKKWIWYASAALLLILLSLIPFIASKPDAEQLYATYLDASKLPTIAVRGNNEDSLLIRAQQLFERKDYEQSLTILENELENALKNRGAIYLYTGIAQMELDQFERAETTFDQLIDSDLMDNQRGYWYKALLYIKKNEMDKAESLLVEITQNSYYNTSLAQDLLDELR